VIITKGPLRISLAAGLREIRLQLDFQSTTVVNPVVRAACCR
jgi:hypothetical protein